MAAAQPVSEAYTPGSRPATAANGTASSSLAYVRNSPDATPPAADRSGRRGSDTSNGNGVSLGTGYPAAGAGPGALDSSGTGGGGTPGSANALRKSTSGGRVGAANMDQLRDRLKHLQGDISQLHAAPRGNRLEELQARMRRLHGSDPGH